MREHQNGLNDTLGFADAFNKEHLTNRTVHVPEGVPSGNVVPKFYFDGTTRRDSLSVPAELRPGLRMGR